MSKSIVVLFVFYLAFAASSLIAEEARGSINVNGRIANMDVAGKQKQIYKDSYLQLLRDTPDGGFKMSSDSKGRITYVSDLARTEINAAGKFRLVANGLEPGKYVIAVQNAGGAFLLKKGTTDIAVVTVPADLKKGLKVDLGDLVVQVR
jgi:hypothetical protein